MDYERERRMAEAQARKALADKDWRMVAYHLYNAARMSLRMAGRAEGRTRESLLRLAKRYQARGDQALGAVKTGAVEGARPKVASEGKGEAAEVESWVIAERPSVRLDDVAGMEEMKEVIETHVVLPMKHADVYAQYALRPGSGVLMYGPPGTGKTFVAKAIAGEVDAAFIPVEMKRILSKWFGETEKLLSDLFDAARSNARSVIFFDEAEALFPKRGSTNSSVMARVVPQLLQLINGLDPNESCVILLGATNRPWLMDEAATRPGRFGRLVYVAPPDGTARAAMMERAMRDTPTQDLDYAALAERTEGYSGADIAGERDSVCVEAKLAALKRTVQKVEAADGAEVEPEPVTMADFDTALTRVGPSIRETDLKKFRKFREDHAAA